MNLRPRDRIVLGVVVLLAAVGAFYVLVLKPEQNKATALQASIATERQSLSQAESNFAVGRAAAASLKADAAQWAALKLALPAQSDIPGLLRALQRNAEAAHVNMQSITLAGASGSSSPTPAMPATPATGATGAGGSATATRASSATGVPIQLTFQGGYAALNRLVHRLDSFVVVSGNKVYADGPLMSISSVSLNSGTNLTIQLSATIYQLQPPPGATGANGAAPTPTTGG